MFSNNLCDDFRFAMNSSEADLGRIEAQMSTDVSHGQRNRTYLRDGGT